jgi:hypothetical protein
MGNVRSTIVIFANGSVFINEASYQVYL